MRLNLKYFGQIAEKTGKNEEVFDIEENITVKDIRQLIEKKYSLSKLPFQVALNKELLNSGQDLKENDELAFLPPFAGG